MEKARAAIKDFTSRTGHHDTTVHETVAPAVQHEEIKPHQHEEVMTAVDKEVHQDHYHTTVQPVQDREVLPEEHHAKLGSVQHRTFDNRDNEGTHRALAMEGAKFKDERMVHDTTQSQSIAPTIGGEHHHHHIHETIQPIVQKETIQPHVVHTTVPIHETHHNPAQHHTASALPAVSMSDFKNRGGVLGGREERYDAFEGEPKNIGGIGAKEGHGLGHAKHDSHHTGAAMGAGALAGGAAGHHMAKGRRGSNSSYSSYSSSDDEKGPRRHHHNTRGTHGKAGTALGAAGGAAAARGMSGREREQEGVMSGVSETNRAGNVGTERGARDKMPGQESGHTSERTAGGPLDSQRDSAHHGNSASDIGNTKKTDQPGGNMGRKPQEGEIGTGVPGFGTGEKSKQGAGPTAGSSLLDKLNPMKDADGDGKKGIMS